MEKETMKVAVLVEKVGAKWYRASTSQPIPLESEGRTQDEAIKRLRALDFAEFRENIAAYRDDVSEADSPARMATCPIPTPRHCSFEAIRGSPGEPLGRTLNPSPLPLSPWIKKP
jgi:hypothetical protein